MTDPEETATLSRRLWVGAVVLALASVFPLLHLEGGFRWAVLDNADALFLFQFFGPDGTVDDIGSWSIPYANYMVPEWPLAFLVALITDDVTWRVVLFGSAQVVGLCLASLYLGRSVGSRRYDAGILIGVALVVFAGSRSQLPPFALVATSYTHVGTFVVFELLLGMQLRWVAQQSNRHLRLLVAGTFLLVASDQIAVVWFVVPSVLAVAWLLGSHRLERSAARTLLLAQFAATAMGVLAPRLLFENRSEYEPDTALGAREWIDAVKIIRDFFSYYLEFHRFLLVFWILCVLLCGSALVIAVRRGGDAARFGAVFFAVGATATLAAQIVMGTLDPAPRYNVPVAFLPLILAPMALSVAGRWSHVRWHDLALGAIVVAVVWPAWAGIDDVDLDRAPVPITCIEEALATTGSRSGIAGHSDDRKIELYSDGRLRMATHDPLLRFWHVNNSTNEIQDSYDFAIRSNENPVNELYVDRLVDLNGPPLQTTTCPQGTFEWTVLDYGPGHLMVDNRMADAAAEGKALEFQGCDLESEIASLVECSLHTDGQAAGFLSYGPYVLLPGGEYEVTATYRSAAGANEVVGGFDINLVFEHLHPTVQATAGELFGTQGASDTVTSSVVIEDDLLWPPLMEWRSWSVNSHELVIDRIAIVRVGD